MTNAAAMSAWSLEEVSTIAGISRSSGRSLSHLRSSTPPIRGIFRSVNDEARQRMQRAVCIQVETTQICGCFFAVIHHGDTVGDATPLQRALDKRLIIHVVFDDQDKCFGISHSGYPFGSSIQNRLPAGSCDSTPRGPPSRSIAVATMARPTPVPATFRSECGAGVRGGAEFKPERRIRNMDTAPTALEVLGLPVPAEWDGRAVREALVGAR